MPWAHDGISPKGISSCHTDPDLLGPASTVSTYENRNPPCWRLFQFHSSWRFCHYRITHSDMCDNIGYNTDSISSQAVECSPETIRSIFSLTHWGRVTHICVGKLTIIGSDNGLSPERHQAIIWTNAGMLLIGPLGTNFSEILIEIQTFSLKKIRLKMSSAKCCSFRLGLNELMNWRYPID